eukprot:CAMPEP_0201491186 /NCGR_PEP_ID=MMETSP0151_2-20130828/28891_1 /ASSEMBLY_ACC=CAM_ASM_000257 /TAXON_ID=200890 /ORGANISM="Paramoeba atlantica, Strain 621/1 / CCAP 1560/9" /LENGTH=331 /DNA_ID=CAMNT_0047877429 /DNA_START=77 /DNA_END=1069 /DNA_ORIENTATION=-
MTQLALLTTLSLKESNQQKNLHPTGNQQSARLSVSPTVSPTAEKMSKSRKEEKPIPPSPSSSQKKKDSGLLFRSFGGYGTGSGQFRGPDSFAVDQKNLILYVAEWKGARIQAFDVDGNFLFCFGEDSGFSSPTIAVDRRDRVVVADYFNCFIQVFDAEGNPLLRFGSKGYQSDQFLAPKGIAIGPQNEIIVVDNIKNSILIFDENGEFLSRIKGEMKDPWDVAVDNSGQIFVSDYSNHQIQVFDMKGNFLFKFSRAGREPGLVTFPTAICELQGKLYVVDSTNRLQVFKSTGEFIWEIKGGRELRCQNLRNVLATPKNIIISDSSHQIQVV